MGRRFNREKRQRNAEKAPLCRVCGGFTQRITDTLGARWECVAACMSEASQ